MPVKINSLDKAAFTMRTGVLLGFRSSEDAHGKQRGCAELVDRRHVMVEDAARHFGRTAGTHLHISIFFKLYIESKFYITIKNATKLFTQINPENKHIEKESKRQR